MHVPSGTFPVRSPGANRDPSSFADRNATMTSILGPADIEEIVAQAYSAIASPEGVIELLGPVSSFASSGADGAGALEIHFENAAGILDKVYPFTPADLAQLKDQEPGAYDSDLTIDAHCRILHVDSAILPDPAFRPGRYLPDWALLGNGAGGSDRHGLPNGDTPGLVRIQNREDDFEGTWFMVRRNGAKPSCRYDFFTVRMQWSDEHGLSFQDALNLSDVETMLLRHLVRGGSLRSFADARNRSIGTVRNQMKVLQRKLSVRSKEEVLLLYAGFVSTLEESARRANSAAHECLNILQTEAGRIAWEEMGDPTGKPVVFFHPLEGALLPRSANRAFADAGLRVIAPWRPFYGDSTGRGFGVPGLTHFADNVRCLMKHLDIAHACGFASQAGAPYMFAAARAAPDLFSHLVGAGAFLPLSGEQELALVPASHRLSINAVRTAPTFARIYQRGMLASIGKGSFQRFVDNFYEGHERELAAVRHPELLAVFRKSATYALANTIDGAIDTMQTWAGDWSGLLVDRAVPLTLIYGSHDANMPGPLVAAVSDRLALPGPRTIANAGSFLLMDAPEALAKAIGGLSRTDADPVS